MTPRPTAPSLCLPPLARQVPCGRPLPRDSSPHARASLTPRGEASRRPRPLAAALDTWLVAWAGEERKPRPPLGLGQLTGPMASGLEGPQRLVDVGSLLAGSQTPSCLPRSVSWTPSLGKCLWSASSVPGAVPALEKEARTRQRKSLLREQKFQRAHNCRECHVP